MWQKHFISLFELFDNQFFSEFLCDVFFFLPISPPAIEMAFASQFPLNFHQIFYGK